MKKTILYFLFCLLFLCYASMSGCRKEAPLRSPEMIDFSALPYKTISEYGFFKQPLHALQPTSKVLKYEPISGLYSDHAFKSRFVWMPEGKSASILDNEMEEIEFPDGSILIKNFYYPDDVDQPEGKKQIIETRLLVKLEGVWEAFPYLWNEAQTEAKYKITGATLPISFTDGDGQKREIDYIQPNKNQCKSCHNQNEKLMPIGPKARNLNYTLAYSEEDSKNQLAKWADVGFLNNYSSEKEYGRMVDFEDIHADLDLRAKAYLDINCGHCHRDNGPGNTSGLILTYEESSDTKWGKFKTPVAAGLGAGPHTYDIYPGKADSSILVYRMNSTNAGVMMPEIGRTTVDEQGVALVSEWINEMTVD